jgi:phosphate transport system substrate-binding protein
VSLRSLGRASPPRRRVAAFVLLVLIAGVARAERAADRPAGAGYLSIVGSETMAPLLHLWLADFKRSYPDIPVSVQSAGSVTAPPALADGVANLAPMSRMMSEVETAAFASRRGYKPTPVRVALDAVTVIVHRQNPLRGLYLAQLDAIFSSTRKCGWGDDLSFWGQLGLAGEWRSRPFNAFGRGPVSGTRDYFREQALCGGVFKKSVVNVSASEGLVAEVGNSPNAIGYVSLGYTHPSVRAIPLAAAAGRPFIEPNPANALAGTYPLTRYLYVYADKPPGRPLPFAVDALIRLALSERGQQSVALSGYIPLPARLTSGELARVR